MLKRKAPRVKTALVAMERDFKGREDRMYWYKGLKENTRTERVILWWACRRL